ncbi:MAG: sulfite exporter TauE/SafE family protein, partial [Duodenibacillus sp.]|nr:sulfite exporter TauE/SafE family protein [Duodenibacillus sp.]
ALSFFVGFLSSILGIGGGVIHVPMMTFILGFPAQIAVATSTCVLGMSSAVGVVSHALLDHIVWAPALAVGTGAIVGAQIGARISKKSKPRMLIVILSFTMVALGVHLVCRGLP